MIPRPGMAGGPSIVEGPGSVGHYFLIYLDHIVAQLSLMSITNNSDNCDANGLPIIAPTLENAHHVIPHSMQILANLALLLQVVVPTNRTKAVLSFPERGVDEAAAYQGYQTRLYKDGAGNTVQIYIDERATRVVHVWADAEDESLGFTARTDGGRAAPLRWDVGDAAVSGGPKSRTRTFAQPLVADASIVHLGWFLLGSMRIERDFQYDKRQAAPFNSPPYKLAELDRLIAALGKLDGESRRRQLALLNAPDVATLERRRTTVTTVRSRPTQWSAEILQASLDGRDTMKLEFRVDPRQVLAVRAGDSLTLRARNGNAVHFTVRISTTGRPLTPLARAEIFTPEFLRFLADTRAAAKDSTSAAGVHARRLERQVRGVELLSSREKLMAGLPTYATYFGRDMLVSALMMRSIWRGAMSEAAIAAALRKLSPTGQVSHEEAMGGQAVREAASEYATLIDSVTLAQQRNDRVAAQTLLRRAGDVLRNARRTRENYHMIDDEFQLPVLVARWITDTTISVAQKRAFLNADGGRGVSRLSLLTRELALVARMTAPYSARPTAENLVSFAPRDATEPGTPQGTPAWASSSWRDSGVGYAGGRYAMDVNAIWAPQALESIARILPMLTTLGFSVEQVARNEPTVASTDEFMRWSRDATALKSAITAWRGAARHFLVQLSPSEVRAGVDARIAAMPGDERAFWNARVTKDASLRDSLPFLAIALDAAAKPIAVANTDPATRLFLGDHEGQLVTGDAADMRQTLRDVRLFTRPYPAGLYIAGIGPAVANDAYAPPGVWNAFVKDPYHGPRVIWGREVNLFLIGLAERVHDTTGSSAPEHAAYVRELRSAIDAVRSAVIASGFHSELWSYGFVNGQLVPQRYGSGADVQLWSTTDLAVEFALARIGGRR